MTTTDPVAVIATFGEAWSHHDVDAALSMLTADCVFEATGPAPDGVRYVGVAAIRPVWKPIFDDHTSHFDTESTIACGDHVIQQWRYSWNGGHVRGVDIFRTDNGLISAKLSYVKG